MPRIRLQRRVREKTELSFPDDIIIEILSRLPAKSVLRCRLVCSGWRDLTSTLDFKDLHMRRSIPMVLVSHYATYQGIRAFNHILLDKWWEPERKRLVYHRFAAQSERRWMFDVKEYPLKFSHGGLIVFQQYCDRNLVILNPMMNETVRIKLSEELWNSSEIYGVFFHPLLREYCTLWMHYVGVNPGGEPDQGCFKMLNLGSKPCWRDISNPWSHRVKVGWPVLIGEYLYWMLMPEQEIGPVRHYDIMKFDIRSEKFFLVHSPVPLRVKGVLTEIRLLDISGVLSFVVTSHKKKQVTLRIWKLKDGEQLWTRINHSFRSEDCLSYEQSQTIAVVGEKLAILLDERLYVCNLKLGTTIVKKYDFPLVFSHVMNLASLRNCKSKISMDKEGEVAEESDVA